MAELQARSFETTTHEHMTVKDWLITMLIMAIPVVNLVMMFIWAFSRSTNPSKSNYFKAMLIMAAIVIVLYIVLGGMILAALAPSLIG